MVTRHKTRDSGHGEKPMYNAKSEPNEFIADSPDEAVAKACDFFGADEDAIDGLVPSPGLSGDCTICTVFFFGGGT